MIKFISRKIPIFEFPGSPSKVWQQLPLIARYLAAPVAYISFALNYYLHGDNVVGFRLLNIIIHVISGILLYFFIQATFHTPAMQSWNTNAKWISFFAAAIWMVHPLQTQSISYIVQRMNSLAAMFYILSFLLYVHFRMNPRKRSKGWLLSGCILAGILALGTKGKCSNPALFSHPLRMVFLREFKSEMDKGSHSGTGRFTFAAGHHCPDLSGRRPIRQNIGGV